MRLGRAPIVVLLFAAASAGSVIPSHAMPSAQAGPGYEAGAELGASVTHGTRIAGAGDFSIGVKTDFFGFVSKAVDKPYAAVVLDVLSVGEQTNSPLGIGQIGIRADIATLGLRQPLPIPGPVPIAIEGGLSYLHTTASGPGVDIAFNPVGGFVGGRVTLTQFSDINVTAMGRYHTENGGFYQAGAGITGPLASFLGIASGLVYQIDYYHTGGGDFATFSNDTDTILIGARWSGHIL